MGDIKSHKVLYLKGALFLVLGLLASINILLQLPTWEVLLSLGLAVWAFSRARWSVNEACWADVA